jgi:hypothetical protein
MATRVATALYYFIVVAPTPICLIDTDQPRGWLELLSNNFRHLPDISGRIFETVLL